MNVGINLIPSISNIIQYEIPVHISTGLNCLNDDLTDFYDGGK
ncbi:hypothetical protein BH11BAC3_BH11BAC3_08070 [soil metagenome]